MNQSVTIDLDQYSPDRPCAHACNCGRPKGIHMHVKGRYKRGIPLVEGDMFFRLEGTWYHESQLHSVIAGHLMDSYE